MSDHRARKNLGAAFSAAVGCALGGGGDGGIERPFDCRRGTPVIFLCMFLTEPGE